MNALGILASIASAREGSAVIVEVAAVARFTPVKRLARSKFIMI
jgi:hypothetical protein